MLPRSQPWGAQRRKRKRKQQELAQSLQRSLTRFFPRPQNIDATNYTIRVAKNPCAGK